MKVKVLYFAEAKKVIKKSEEYINFDGDTLFDLKEVIMGKYPKIADVINASMFAINTEYVQLGEAVREGDTIAIIPPVGGG